MILTCERCETRFRLDESRLPARGARVRCSKCKHAFFVRPPGATDAAAIDEVAQQAAAAPQKPVPEPSWDLEDADPGSTLQRPAPLAEPPNEFEDENDWRFEDELPQLGDTGASLDLPNGAAPPPAAPDPNDSSFAELGDPESWNLLSSSSSDITAARLATSLGVDVAAPAEDVPVEMAPVAAPAREESRREQAIATAPMLRAPLEARSGTRLAGWAATALLVAAVVLGSVWPRPEPVAVGAGVVPVGSMEMTVRATRLVENALAGPVWVVSGELRNPASEPRALESEITVSLLDETGAAIEGAVATVRPSLPAERLRQADPIELRAEANDAAAALAYQALDADARIPVDAVFASGARNAARIAIATKPIAHPAPPDPPAPAFDPSLPVDSPAAPTDGAAP